ncbi:MAG: VOC family protein [Pseudomonadota bacterium]
MAVTGLSHVNLTCPAELETEVLRFYREVLELAPIAKAAGRRSTGGWFDLGGPELHISVDPVSVDEQRANPRHLALFVDNLTRIEERLRSAGAELLDDPRPPAHGRRRFALDPAGNRLEFVEAASR